MRYVCEPAVLINVVRYYNVCIVGTIIIRIIRRIIRREDDDEEEEEE